MQRFRTVNKRSAKARQASSDLGRKAALKRWADHNALIDEKIRAGELPPPPPEWPRDQPYYTVALTHHPTGRQHIFDLYPAIDGRRDQFQIRQDSRLWKTAIGLTRFFRGLRAAMFGENAEHRATSSS